MDDLKDKFGQFHEKIETQINQLTSMREKVSSIKENYDKKFDELF
jgi:archaellum component FlaC